VFHSACKEDHHGVNRFLQSDVGILALRMYAYGAKPTLKLYLAPLAG